MKKTTIILFTLSMLIYATSIKAQIAIPAAGGNASGAGGKLSYSIGQVVYSTGTGANGSTSQGIQQPYEISVVTGIEEASGISLEIIAYPNPAQDYVILKIKNYEVENLSYQLYDVNGSIIKDNKVEGNETTIVMQNLKPSAYFLKVTDKNKVIKTFKIIKK
jgi:hypothetical protein